MVAHLHRNMCFVTFTKPAFSTKKGEGPGKLPIFRNQKIICEISQLLVKLEKNGRSGNARSLFSCGNDNVGLRTAASVKTGIYSPGAQVFVVSLICPDSLIYIICYNPMFVTFGLIGYKTTYLKKNKIFKVIGNVQSAVKYQVIFHYKVIC